MGTSATTPSRPRRPGAFPVRDELRLAVAMNGGVSLAVWIGGVATELERFRRADSEPTSAAEASSWQQVRSGLGVERVVIDVLAGSSAGGLNAVFLALAQAFEGVSLDELRDVWFELADFDTELLRHADDARPRTPLDGDYFLHQLQRRIAAMVEDKRPSGNAVDLRITATSLRGRPEDFPDLIDAHFVNSDHEVSFRFRKDAAGAGDFTGAGDHLSRNLAIAGRASASFPVAFEPVLVDPKDFGRDEPGVVDGIGTRRFLVDGGVLNNLPVDRAVEAIFYRPADEPVNRVLLAVIPLHHERTSDDSLSLPDESNRPYSTFAVGFASGITIPRNESSADGLHDLDRLNRDSTMLMTARSALFALSFESVRATGEGLWPVYVRQQLTITSPAETSVSDELPPWLPDDPWQPGTRRSGAAVRRAAAIVLDVLTRVAETPGPAAVPDLAVLRGRVYDCIQCTARLDPYDPEDPQLALTRSQLFEIREGGDLAGGDLDVGGELGRAFDDLAAVVAEVAPAASQVDGLPSLGFGAAVPGAAHRWLTALEVSLGALGPAVNPQSIVHPAIISPARAAPIDPLHREHPDLKLAGDELGHFGAFLKRAWRANDWLWGRLDAASALGAVCGRFGLSDSEVTDLVRSAQAEIVRQEAPALVMAIVYDIDRGAKTPRGCALINAGDPVTPPESRLGRLRSGVTWESLVDELRLEGDSPEREFLRRLDIGRETVKDEWRGTLLTRVGVEFAAVMTKVALNAQLPTLVRRVLSIVLVPMRYVTGAVAHFFGRRRRM